MEARTEKKQCPILDILIFMQVQLKVNVTVRVYYCKTNICMCTHVCALHAYFVRVNEQHIEEEVQKWQ